jgi:hypothetical protein
VSTEPTWRVYLTEWLTVYTADFMGSPGEQDCWDHFAGKYAGRVREKDREVASSAPDWWPVLRLRLPNLRGEFKDHGDALDLASELMDGHKDGPCDLVRRGSDEEKALLEYGKKMLPEQGTGS